MNYTKVRPQIFFWIIFCAIVLIGLLIIYMTIVLPCPLQTYLTAKTEVMYSASWPISEDDYLEAERLVKQELEEDEIIVGVTVESRTKIIFFVHHYYRATRAISGCEFGAMKENGVWSVIRDATSGLIISSR
jgi:hypothetical protein